MRYQPLPELDVQVYLGVIFRSKHTPKKQLLLAAEARIFELCQEYVETLSVMRPPPRQEWDPHTKSALQSCYDGPTARLNDLKDEILESLRVHAEVNLQRCAYCMLSEPITWDHYLPKSFYPEFSAYHANLIYTCFGCNHKKHDKFSETELIYSHPYYTIASDTPILHCTISIQDNQLSIDYYCAGEGAHEVAGRIAHEHFLRLGLNNRFKGEASSLISGFIGEVRALFQGNISQDSLKNLLHAKYIESQAHLGINAWDARLWHGLNQCTGFIGYINQQLQSNTAPSSDGFDIPAPLPQH
ncbi:HNH endonuclease [Pseudomonas farris]